MSYIALAFTACLQGGECNVYHIDPSDSDLSCSMQMLDKGTSFAKAWEDINSVFTLQEWLDSNGVTENAGQMIGARFDCQVVISEETP